MHTSARSLTRKPRVCPCTIVVPSLVLRPATTALRVFSATAEPPLIRTLFAFYIGRELPGRYEARAWATAALASISFAFA
jgi:hypothetical protein